ncbi:MAG: SpoIIIAH-like family protein [Christensenellales bacterium]|jgi:hypothetical protein
MKVKKMNFKFNQKTVVLIAMTVLLVITGALSIWYNRQNADTPMTADGMPTATVSPSPSPSPGTNGTNGLDNGDEDMENGDTEGAATVAKFFSDFRSERNTVRAEEIAYLDSIVNNTNSDQSIINQAQQEKIKIVTAMEKEVTIEGLLKAQGFSDAIATLHEGSVNVVVGLPQLSDSQVAQILEIVRRESGEEPANIKIIPAG